MGHHGNSFLSFPAVGEVGGWIELGRTTLGSATSTIDVSSISDKRYYQILINYADSIDSEIRFNGISTTTYANRRSDNGGTDSTQTSQDKLILNANASGTNARLIIGYIANLAANEKLLQSWTVTQQTAGAANAPNRTEAVGKHAQTTNPIDQMTVVNTIGDFPIGAELIVLGWDPADTHTSNFWEVLADVDLSTGEADTISSGTFTAKKYLWVQCFLESSGTVQDGLRVGNGSVDTGSNYSYRFSTNGSSDSTQTSATDIGDFSNISNGQFLNMFIVNNASNEKLIQYWINEGKSGAGTAPTRLEVVGKWANTSNQINILEWRNVAGAGNYGKATFIKVWGSD